MILDVQLKKFTRELGRLRFREDEGECMIADVQIGHLLDLSCEQDRSWLQHRQRLERTFDVITRLNKSLNR